MRSIVMGTIVIGGLSPSHRERIRGMRKLRFRLDLTSKVRVPKGLRCFLSQAGCTLLFDWHYLALFSIMCFLVLD